MLKVLLTFSVLFGLLLMGGCSGPPDAPNVKVAGPKDPAAIKILDDIKALPNGKARRDYMASHQKETQVLHSDSGAWFEASKLAWDEPGIQPSSLADAAKKGK